MTTGRNLSNTAPAGLSDSAELDAASELIADGIAIARDAGLFNCDIPLVIGVDGMLYALSAIKLNETH